MFVLIKNELQLTKGMISSFVSASYGDQVRVTLDLRSYESTAHIEKFSIIQPYYNHHYFMNPFYQVINSKFGSYLHFDAIYITFMGWNCN